jgi:hypothetical protein
MTWLLATAGTVRLAAAGVVVVLASSPAETAVVPSLAGNVLIFLM